MKNIDLSSLLYPSPAPLIACQSYDVKNEAQGMQLLGWRQRMGGVIDLLPTIEQVAQPFCASVNRYTVGKLSFSDLYSDPIRVERSIARISTDRACDFFLFTVCVDGISHTLEGRHATRKAPLKPKILALDLDQPIRMQGHRHRFSSFLAPRILVESIVPDADTLHGRAVDASAPIARLIIAHTVDINQKIGGMSQEAAHFALQNAIHLICVAFGRQTKLSGSSRAAIRAVMFSRTKNYIKAHLEDPTLSADSLLYELQLPRHTLYRMFEQEGGIAAYICNSRLRASVDDIVNLPNLALKDIAYGVGFNSASAFSRAFRRTYEMTPLELREYVSKKNRNEFE